MTPSNTLAAVLLEISELQPRVREIVTVQQVLRKLNGVARAGRKRCSVLQDTPPIIRKLHALRSIVANPEKPVKFILQSSSGNVSKRRYVLFVASGGGRRNVLLDSDGGSS